MKKIAIVQSSLRPNSNTAIVTETFQKKCEEKWLEVSYIDLREIELEFCDARLLESYSDGIQKSYRLLEGAEAIFFGMPVYQYTMSGVLKNFIDITGKALAWKYIGVFVNAGGQNCYMASRDLFDCLYYEYGTYNLSPTPYTFWQDFRENQLENEKVLSKLDELIEKIISL